MADSLRCSAGCRAPTDKDMTLLPEALQCSDGQGILAALAVRLTLRKAGRT